MNKALFISLFSVLLLLSEMVSGQDGIKIQGKVTDNNGSPLIGVNVVIINSSYGSSTDRNGSYIIDLPASEKEKKVILEARYVGFISQSVEIILKFETTHQNFVLEEDVLSIKTVVVTAQRREENLQTVPISITAIESDKIQTKGANQVVDLRYAVPNLSFGSGASYTYGMLTSIRGIARIIFFAGVEPRAGIYVDDVYSGRTVSFNQDLLEIERVAVLRGPQGTLFGKNSISGLINISTRKPHGRLEGSVSLEGGSYNYLSTKFMLNVPLIENKFFAKIGGKISRRDGYVTNLYNNKDMNGEDIIGGRLQFRYLVSDELEFLLSLDAFQNTMDPRTDAMANDGSNNNPRELSHDAEEFDYLDLYNTALTVDYRLLSGHNLKSISAFRWNNDWDTFDLDVSPLFVAYTDESDTTRQFTQEFRLASPLNGLFDYVAGLYYFYQNTDKKNSFFTPGLNVHSNAVVKTNSFACYFNGNFHLSNNLTLTAGLRYTYDYRTVQFDQINDPSPILCYIDVDNYTDTYSEAVFSPKLGLNFSLSPNVFLYGFVAQGFTSGGWDVYYIHDIENIKFLPEYATSFELGLKSNLLNNRVVANLSAFITKFTDYQVFQYYTTEDCGLLGSFKNAGKVTTKGFELDLSVNLLKELKVNGGLGYADARYDEFKDAGDKGIHYDGNRLPWAPKNEYNISIEYQQSIGNLGSIFLFGEFVHQGNYFTLPSNNIETTFVDSHELLNARIGFHFANNLLGISIWGKNLLDELYMLGNFPLLFETSNVWYGPPRTFGVEIYYNFLR